MEGGALKAYGQNAQRKNINEENKKKRLHRVRPLDERDGCTAPAGWGGVNSPGQQQKRKETAIWQL